MSLCCVRPGADFDFVFSLVTSPVVDFFNHVNMLYGTIAEFCTKETVSPCCQKFNLKSRTDLDLFGQCPIMSAGPRCAVLLSCRDRHAVPNGPRTETADTSCLLFPAFRFEFLFEDGTTYKKPTALPAPEYVDALMNWVQSLLDDEDVFPSRIGQLLVRRVA